MRLPLMLAAGLVLSLAAFAVAAEPAECEAPGTNYSGWAFMPSRFSHDPYSGARVAQYAPLPSLPALPNATINASAYQRTRVNQVGADGSISTYYYTENWSNRPDRIDAEWERFNDVWQRSVLSGGYRGW